MNDHAALGRDIFVIEKYFRLYFKNALKEYDVNSTEAMVLLAFYEKGGPLKEDVFKDIHENQFAKTQDQIISELHYDKAAMTRTMQSLEKKGFVIRKDNPDDSRSFLFFVTDKANQFKPKLINILKEWNDLLMKDIENIDIVKTATKKMAQNARQMI
ncbi:MAG: MarR family transcriptional regulator [Bacillota bacterium]|nr:MarR family transcriptional regulator [Bacillota bacterium]